MHRKAIIRTLAMTIAAATVSACGAERETTAPTPPVPPPPTVLLKDIAIPNLPAPYYHFEYDAMGRVSAASFASGLTMYDVIYDGGRIAEMRNNTLGNRDRLEYAYDDAGRVDTVRYVDPSGRVYTTLAFSYDGQRLTGMERERSVGAGFVTDKTIALSYHADGNLLELTVHRPPIDGRQEESTTVDRFEQYDEGINVDGFGLIHDEFFDHLVLLPGVQLQRGNPGRQIHTGDGINFTADYTYVYDDRRRPLTRTGDVRVANGPNPGQTFRTISVFSYY